MPNLVYDTPTPPSQLYNSGIGMAGAASSLRPRFQQQQNNNQPIITSTVLPKSRLREQYRPEMDYDLDGSSSSSSDSTFSSTDLAVHNNNNSPRNKYRLGGTTAAAAAAAQVDENRPPSTYYRSPGYGDAGKGPGMNDKQRFLDVQQSSKRQRGNYLSTRVDEHSDASLDSRSDSTRTSSSDSEDDIAARARFQSRPSQQQPTSSYPNKASAVSNLTSTPYPGPGVSSNNISKSAFDGMARELRKEFDRIMHAGQEPATNSNNNYSPAPVTSNPSPPQFRSRRNSAVQALPDNGSPSYVQGPPTSLPRAVLPRRPSSAAATRASQAQPAPTPVNRDHERTPTSQRTFGQEIRFPRQEASTGPSLHVLPSRPSQPKTAVPQYRPVSTRTEYQAASPFQVLNPIPGTIPPNNTRASNQTSYRAADSPGRASNASSYNAIRVPDITGLTEGLTSPSRVESGPSSHREFARANGTPISSGRTYARSQEDPALTSALSGLRRRLEALESENARSEAKVAELQDRLASRDHAAPMGQSANPDLAYNPNAFVQTLRDEISQLQTQIEAHNRTLSRLQSQQPQVHTQFSNNDYNPESWQSVFSGLREALQHLADQVMAVRQVLEDVLQSMKNNPSQYIADRELFQPQPANTARIANDSEPAMRTSGQYPPTLSQQPARYALHSQRNLPNLPPLSQPSPPQRATSAPLTQAYQAEYRVPRTFSNPLPDRPATQDTDPVLREPLLDRAQRILSSVPPRVDAHIPTTCDVCRRQLSGGAAGHSENNWNNLGPDDSHPGRSPTRQQYELPMQTVVTRALRDLEEDFAVHKRIYIDLSDEFKLMDPATPDVGRRKILASHLKESIDILEMKADEIKRLYDLLHYRSELQNTSGHERMKALARNINKRFI